MNSLQELNLVLDISTGTKTDPNPIQRTETIPLDSTKDLLVKFNFSRENLIPSGITQRDRYNNLVSDRRQVQAAEKHGENLPFRTRVGRERDGRIDTALEVLKEESVATSPDLIVRGLTNNDFVLVGVYWFGRDKPAQQFLKSGNKRAFVVELRFRHKSRLEEDVKSSQAKLERKSLDAIRALANTPWGKVFVYKNGPEATCNTINFTARTPDQRPQKALVVRDGNITLVEVGQ